MASKEPECERCWNRGWYPQCTNPEEPDVFNLDFRETYCECKAGRERKARETADGK